MKWKAQFWRSPESQFAFCLVFLFLVQAWQTHAFWHRLVLEDAAESLRAPYWFVAERTVYNGVACDLPYYVALSLAYKIFGFSVYMAKILRLGLHAFSLLALAELLRRWLGARQALVPLAAAGLSPTWLYLNTNQVQLGIDLQLMPILMLGALLLPLSGHPARCFLSMMAWAALFLICAMIFPSSVFYGPVMAAFLLGRWLWQPARIGWGWLLGGALLGAVLPIAASLLALKDPQLLIYDPVTKAGLFRGGGGGFSLDPKAFAESAVVVLQDLFIEGTSYNFDLPYAEFSSWISRISFTLLMMGAILWPLLNGRNSNRTQNWVGAWLLGSLLFLFCAPQLLHKFPGLRRTTGALFAYYGLLSFIWAGCRTWPRAPAFRAVLGIAILGSLFGNAQTLGLNAAEARISAQAKNLSWFHVRANPEDSLLYWEEATRKGAALRCEEFNFSSCRYAEIFGAIQGYRYWNHLPSSPIIAWDPLQQRYRQIDISLWENHIWPQ